MAAEYATASQSPACTTCYLVWDHLDSTRLVTDQNATVVTRHDFLPFGEEISANTAGRNSQWGSAADVEQKFTGQIRDQETGMDYFHARYFGSALGRFTSPDPDPGSMDLTNPQSFNRYAYVLGNPLALVDPSGADCQGNNDGVACITDNPPPACSWWQFWCWGGGGGSGDGESDEGDFGGDFYGSAFYFRPYGPQAPQPPPPRITEVKGGQPPKNWLTDLVPTNPCLYSGRALPPSGYASAGKAAKSSLVTFILDVLKGFPRGDYLDAQPLGAGNALQRAAYGNYAFGVYTAAAGIPRSVALAGANGFAFVSGAKYGPRNGPTDPLYSSLPLANTVNIEHGYSDQQNGMTCHN